MARDLRKGNVHLGLSITMVDTETPTVTADTRIYAVAKLVLYRPCNSAVLVDVNFFRENYDMRNSYMTFIKLHINNSQKKHYYKSKASNTCHV